MLTLIFVAVSLGLTNLAGALAIGLTGVDAGLRLRVALAFGLFEGGMPLVGLLLGRGLAGALGTHSNWLAALLLVTAGLYTIFSATHESEGTAAAGANFDMRRLLATGLALSIDNLVIGFALGAYDVNVVLAAALIAAVSVAMSLVGLELGSRLGRRLGQRSELIGGAILIVVGGAIGIGLL